MKALRIYENAIVKVEEVEEPVVGNTDVKIKVAACGICGSDIPRVLDNKAHFYPITLGHEFSGIVTEVGKDVSGINIGDSVAGVPLLPCMDCADCNNGNYSLCKNYSFIGSRLNGAMAEYVVVPQGNVIKLPKSMNLEDAAMIEPLSVVLHAFKQNRHQENRTVAILGMGTIGALATQVAKCYGAEKIAVVVRNNKYDILVRKIGVDTIINTSNKDWLQQVKNITDNRGFDMVYETAGAIQTMQQAFEIAANKAHICFVGTPKKEITFSNQMWELLNRKEFWLTGSWMSYSKEFPGDEWRVAVELIKDGSVKIFTEMINEKVRLTDSSNVFDDYKDNGTVMGRKLIVME